MFFDLFFLCVLCASVRDCVLILDDTIVAISTPPGRGLGVVRFSGRDAARIAGTIHRGAPINRVFPGFLCDFGA
jgi:hypothetical protein